jgi:hypothetical protein
VKVYSGTRNKNGDASVRVFTGDREPMWEPTPHLRLRLDLACHSPSGFNWGYGGSGPAQLALALLADALGNDKRALELHQAFKWRLVGDLEDDWTMTDKDVRRIAGELSTERLTRSVSK